MKTEIELKEEYLYYLHYCQGNTKIPEKTYTDWAGLVVLSFEDWKKEIIKNEINL